jgi:hypothetical protein
MAEGEVLDDPIMIGFVHHGGGAETAAALGALAREKVAFARTGTQSLAGSRDFEPLRNGFPCLNAFWTTHKNSTFSKEKSAKYR